MKKLIAVLALGASIATVAAPETTIVQASSTINDTAKQNSFSGVTYAEQVLAQEGIKYNDFSAANPINYRNGKPEGVVIHGD